MGSSRWNFLRTKGKNCACFLALSFLLFLLFLHLTFDITAAITNRFLSSYHLPIRRPESHRIHPPLSPPGAPEGGREWETCRVWKGIVDVDYIPCLDNIKAIKQLKSKRHMEHWERHCPEKSPRCLVALPRGYRIPVPWPKSRDEIWFNNVPHTKLAEYKKSQNWMQVSGEYLVFPGGGTQFKKGVTDYIQFIEQTLPTVDWGGHTRVVLDVGCGVASFGGFLLDRDVITMSVAPKDVHEAQIQLALERGIPAILSVIGTQRLPFSDNSYDAIHCARCRVHWDADGGKPLLELNRILRPGGIFIWSATPVYRDNKRDIAVWNAMLALTKSMCWTTVVKATGADGIGLTVFRKPTSNLCFEKRTENIPPMCDEKREAILSWYVPLDGCLPKIPVYSTGKQDGWPSNWPERLTSRPSLLEKPMNQNFDENFEEDTKHWNELVSYIYLQNLGIVWTDIRNVMDMNAGYGGFAAALIGKPLWVMNVVPVNRQDTLSTIFDRGLIGIYHDWCEAFNTYPRSYDLLHSSYFLGNLSHRCEITDVAVEMDRILRPGGWLLVQDTIEIIHIVQSILQSFHWNTTIHHRNFLVGRKSFWRPNN